MLSSPVPRISLSFAFPYSFVIDVWKSEMLSETLLKPAFTDSITFSLCTSKSGGGSYPTQPLLIIKFTTCQMALHKYCVNNSLQAPESPFPVVLTCIKHVDNEVIKFLRN